MIHTAILTLSLGGFAVLMLAMPRHQQDWLRRKLPLPVSRTLRLTGLAMLALAFVVSAAELGWAYGAVCWLGWLTMAATAIVAANTNRQRLLRKIRG